MNPFLSVALFLVLKSVGFFITFFPRKLELFIGPYLGRVIFLFSKRKRIAADNLLRCFPGWSESRRDLVLKENYEHYGLLALELLHLFSPFSNHYRAYVKKNTIVHGMENWTEARKQKGGVLFSASHLGNWELMVSGGAIAGFPVTMVTKHLKPEWMHKTIERARASTGVSGAYEPRTLPAILRAIRAREAVGFVMDQYAGPPIGEKVPFFGTLVGTLSALGTLHNRTGADVLPVKAFRDTRGKVHIFIFPVLKFSEKQNPTAVLAERVEGWIRENPEQWLWIHRRFKNTEPINVGA